MKKQYIVPQAEIVNVRLLNSVLDEGNYGRNSIGAYGGDEPGYGDAKGNDEVVDDDDLGYSPIQTDWSTE